MLTATVATVAGCVGMPASGPVGAFSASPQSTTPAGDAVGLVASGPEPGWSASDIVQGFLAASADYPTEAAIARQYLVSSASKTWNPGWAVDVFGTLVPGAARLTTAGRHASEEATVDVTGDLQATFNGTGQYVAAQGQAPAGLPYPFHLVKVDGQWRITNPPDKRLLTGNEFAQAYEAQDLYFFDPTDQVLVPDSVFVPQDTTPTLLITNLVRALIQGPQTAWLQTSTDTDVFPSGTKDLGVTLSGDVAVVDLGGALARASTPVLQRVSAELVWTLASTALGGPQKIQSVELQLNGKAPLSLASPCGTGQGQSPVQKLAAYQCYDPYPSAPSSFYYVNGGQAWSRCGWESQAQVGSIGTIVPVFGRGGAQSCSFETYQSATAPPAQQPSLPALSKVAVSPDGRYVAGVNAAGNAVSIRPLAGGATATARLGPGITALGWDRDDYLWVAQDGNISVVSPSGRHDTVSVPWNVTGLSVAPDGVRIALIVQGSPQTQVILTAINRSASAAGSLGQIDTVSTYEVQLGPNVVKPLALTWYDADNLIVLSAGSRLWQVPVDGQQALGPEPAPQGAVSVSADGPANALVVGLSGGRIAVSAGLNGSWQTLGNLGQAPAYPAPLTPGPR
jgi:Lipoprotein LpqB beta-propeller domain/Sporulation and spore germination